MEAFVADTMPDVGGDNQDARFHPD